MSSRASNSRHPGLGFVALFTLLYVVQHGVYQWLPDQFLADVAYRHGIVAGAASVIEWFAPGERVAVDSNRLTSPRAVLEIVRGCDGSGVLFLLFAAVLALRAGPRHTATGLLGALLLVYLLNQLRVVGLYFVAAYRGEWFTPLHGYLAPTLFVVIAALYFAWWAARLPR